MTASETEAATVAVPMPRLSDSMEEGTVVRWLVEDGERVECGQEIVEIETDKATMAFEAPVAGQLWILAATDAVIAVGAPLAEIGEARRDEAPSEVELEAPRVSPLARRLAAKHGIRLETVSGSGPRGRIVKEDVLRAVEAAGDATAAPIAPAVPAVSGARGGSRRVEPTRTQAIVARRMAEARTTVPEFPVSAEVEMSAALALREQLRGAAEPVPSLNDLLCAAVARTLREHPRLNAAYVDGGFELYEQINLGIAVAAGDELIVPVLPGADRLGLLELAATSRRLVAKVREGTVTPPELAGGTFTISNLGMFGISSFQPIVNPPQAAILGIGAVVEPSTGPPLLSLTLVSDHRIVYGAHAAAFLADLRQLLQRPALLLAA